MERDRSIDGDASHHAPRLPEPLRQITIVDRSRLVMPAVCAVCGAPQATTIEYTQDHIPIITPIFVSFRSTRVVVPYCPAHAERFLNRFLWLQRGRVLICIILLAAVAIVLLPELLEVKLPIKHSLAIGILLGGVALICLLMSYVLKPFLYDVFFTIAGPRLQIKNGSMTFVEAVAEANPGNVAQ